MQKEQQTLNMGYKLNDVIINSIGVGGATALPGRKCLQNSIRRLLECRPNIVYLHVGENDLRGGQAANISSSIIELVSILAAHVSVVIVSQLLLFPVNRSKKETVLKINVDLDNAFKRTPNVHFWKHRSGFWNSDSRGQIFDRWGVHLSDYGHLKYLRSVKSALNKNIKTLNADVCRSADLEDV